MYKPSSNIIILTVEPQATTSATSTKTMEELRGGGGGGECHVIQELCDHRQTFQHKSGGKETLR